MVTGGMGECTGPVQVTRCYKANMNFLGDFCLAKGDNLTTLADVWMFGRFLHTLEFGD